MGRKNVSWASDEPMCAPIEVSFCVYVVYTARIENGHKTRGEAPVHKSICQKTADNGFYSLGPE